MSISIREFRDYAESLGRFASSKEKKVPGPKDTASHKHQAYPIIHAVDAVTDMPLEHRPSFFACKGCSKTWLASEINRTYEPTDRVLIQASRGRLKLVAGTADSTLVVDAGETTAQGKALVSAKLVLNSAKALRGKGTVEFTVSPAGAAVRVSTGAEMLLANVDDAMPDWVRPKVTSFAVPFGEGFLAEAARVFDATTGKSWPYSHIAISAEDGILTLTATDRYAYSSVSLEGAEELPEQGYLGSISSVFTGQLRGLDAAGQVHVIDGKATRNGGYLTDEVVTLVSGPYTAATRFVRAASLPHTDMFAAEAETSVSLDKKVLIDMVKGVGTNDQHNRVTLVARNAALTIHPYQDPTTSMKVPAKVEGADGSVGVSADILSRCLTAYPGKTASLGWSRVRAPITLLDRSWPWRMYLAPLVS